MHIDLTQGLHRAARQTPGHVACRGEVTEIFEAQGQLCARLALTAANQAGETRLSGEAVVAI